MSLGRPGHPARNLLCPRLLPASLLSRCHLCQCLPVRCPLLPPSVLCTHLGRLTQEPSLRMLPCPRFLVYTENPDIHNTTQTPLHLHAYTYRRARTHFLHPLYKQNRTHRTYHIHTNPQSHGSILISLTVAVALAPRIWLPQCPWGESFILRQVREWSSTPSPHVRVRDKAHWRACSPGPTLFPY